MKIRQNLNSLISHICYIPCIFSVIKIATKNALMYICNCDLYDKINRSGCIEPINLLSVKELR